MRTGDVADCMYILYYGQVGVYKDRECEQFIVNLTPNKVFGETALQKHENRSASIMATKDSRLLKLEKIFYKTIV